MIWVLRQGNDPIEKVNYVAVMRNHRRGIVASAEKPARLVFEITMCEKATHRECKWLEQRSTQRISYARRKNDSFTKCFAAIKRLRGDNETTVSMIDRKSTRL